MGKDSLPRSDLIAIRWAKLEALEVSHVFSADSPTSFHGDYAGIRIPDPFKTNSKVCNSLVSMASLSSIFWRKKDSRTPHPSSSFASVSFTPIRGTYAHDFLQSRFKELDVDDYGCISEGDLKVALKRLNLPASEKDVQGFLNRVGGSSNVRKVSFENFAEYAVHLENKLVDTFKEVDLKKTGYITSNEMEASLKKYNFRITDSDVEKVVHGFHARGSILRASGYYRSGQVFDFAEFRELLMVTSFKDLRDPGDVWGRAKLDLGDADISFPVSSGPYFIRRHEEQQKSKQKALNHLLSGVVSGFVSRTAVAPLERVKILSMVGNSTFTKNGLPSAVIKLWREEGIHGLFRGNLLNVLRIVPTKILEYLLYSNSKEMVLRKANKTDLNGTEVMLLGAAVSMAGTLISHPIDTVRTALTVQVAGTQIGIFESTRAILKDKGFSGVYRGIIPSMMRTLPYLALNCVVYNELEQMYRKKHGPGGKLEPLPTVCFGVLGGAAAQVAIYPLETLQRHLQAQALQQSPIMCHNMIDAFRLIIQDEGLKGLYAGLLPNLLKLVPAAAISFIAYEALNKTLESKEWFEAQKSTSITKGT